MTTTKTEASPLEAYKFGGLNIKALGDTAQQKCCCMIIYGPPGTGKTTFAATMARYKPAPRTLLVDVEGGSSVVADWPEARSGILQVTDPPISSYQEIKNLMNALKVAPVEQIPWDNIVIDNLSEIQVLNLRGITSEIPSYPEYHQSQQDISAFVRACRDLAKVKGINIIIIAWDEVDKEELPGGGTLTKRVLGLTPKLGRLLPGIVDYVGVLSIMDQPPEFPRLLSFAPSKREVTKTRAAQSDPMARIPLQIYKPTMESILAVVKGGEPWPEAKHRLPSAAAPQTRAAATTKPEAETHTAS